MYATVIVVFDHNFKSLWYSLIVRTYIDYTCWVYISSTRQRGNLQKRFFLDAYKTAERKCF